jgi:Mrp family chromosome partitioning ATPase
VEVLVVELKVFVSALRRGLVPILLLTVLGGLWGGVVRGLLPERYEATASLLLDPLAVTVPGEDPFSGDPERYVSGQLRILESAALVERAAQAVPGVDVETLQDSLELTHVVGSDIVDITATADRAEVARDVANALATTYVEDRRAASQAAVTAQLDAVNAQIAELEGSLPAAGPQDSAARQVLATRLEQLLGERAALASPAVVKDVTALVDPARLPTAPERVSLPVAVAGGALVGAFLALAAVSILEARSPHVVTRSHAEVVLGRPVLVTFSKTRGKRRRRLARLLPEAQTLAASIAGAPAEGKRRVVAVCSSTRSAGNSTVAAAVAAAFAQQGSHVALLPLDDGRAHALLPAVGEAEAVDADLRGSAGGWTLHEADRPGVTVVQRPVEWGQPQFEEVLALTRALPEEHDVVVLDVPPVLESPLGAQLSRWVDDVVLVVPVPEQKEPDLALTQESLGLGSGVRTHAVLNRRGTVLRRGRRA